MMLAVSRKGNLPPGVPEERVDPHVASTAVAAVVSGVAASAEDDGIDQDGLPAAEQELNQTAIVRGNGQCLIADTPAGGTGLLDVLLDLGGERLQNGR
jgi:hypothetical protein